MDVEGPFAQRIPPGVASVTWLRTSRGAKHGLWQGLFWGFFSLQKLNMPGSRARTVGLTSLGCPGGRSVENTNDLRASLPDFMVGGNTTFRRGTEKAPRASLVCSL